MQPMLQKMLHTLDLLSNARQQACSHLTRTSYLQAANRRCTHLLQVLRSSNEVALLFGSSAGEHHGIEVAVRALGMLGSTLQKQVQFFVAREHSCIPQHTVPHTHKVSLAEWPYVSHLEHMRRIVIKFASNTAACPVCLYVWDEDSKL